jgi:simple sugar transport system ATP-binding protein
VSLEGLPHNVASPFEAQRKGISTLFQEVNLIPELSVAENLMIGREPRRFGLIQWQQLRVTAQAALDRLGVPADVNRPAGSYSTAIQQMIAIARAVDQDARVLVLDEPTASLDGAEVAQLFQLMRRLCDDGLGILFVTHFLDQVYAISDRITVLRNGAQVGVFATAELPRAELVGHMLGRALGGGDAKRPPSSPTSASKGGTPEAPLLRALGIGRRNAVERVDLVVQAGRVVGLAGLLGSGRTETARLLFGIDHRDVGELESNGRPVSLAGPRDAIRLGFGFCPEDRKAEGLLPDLSVVENIVLAEQGVRGWRRRIPSSRQRQLAATLVDSLAIVAADLDQPVSHLSGGNQQKVLLARWLATNPRLLILDEPTRGVDVGARAEIESLIEGLCAKGMAVLLVSSELEETARLSHEVVVMRERKSVAHLKGSQVKEGEIARFV